MLASNVLDFFRRLYGGPYAPNRQRPKFASLKYRPIKISPYLTTRLTTRNPEALYMKALHTQALYMEVLHTQALYIEAPRTEALHDALH
jgi:hypothetical protein